MNKEEIYELTQKYLSDSSIVLFEQIPDIELYMDQLTTFIEDRLKGYKRNVKDKVLTKTMINNYTKDSVLPPSEKKKYNKEHIALLILIYHMKSSLTINDISLIFDMVEKYEISVESFYRSFTAIQEKELVAFDEIMKEKLNEVEKFPEDDNTLKLLLIISLIIESNTRKLLAERLIDRLLAKPVIKN